MNLALAHYNKADSKNFEDIEQSMVVVKDHLDLLQKSFINLIASITLKELRFNSCNTLNMAAEFVQITQELEKRFMYLAKTVKSSL